MAGSPGDDVGELGRDDETPPELGITATNHANNAVVVAVVGEIDLATAAPLREAVLRLVHQQPRLMVLNLEAVTFIDSSGLRSLVAVHRRARALDVKLRLACLPPIPRRTLEITRLDMILPMFDTAAEALSAQD
jgi:anti-anti-sigma factor